MDERRQTSSPGQAPDTSSQPPAAEVAARLRTTFGIGYLTLTGVTQSVALAVLAARVEATFDQFDLANWVLTIATFLLIVLVWNEYLIASIAYVWTPTIADALLPFTLLALQLFVAHNVYPDEQLWLFALGSFLAAGAIAFAYGFFQAGRHAADNRDVLRAIGTHRALTMIFTGGGCLLAVGTALLYEPLDLDRADTAVAFVALAMIVVTLLRSIPYWNRITAFARSATRAP